jgi:hypothetical protein
MVVLSVIAMLGFLYALTLHLAAALHGGWVLTLTDVMLVVPFVLGGVLTLLMIIYAWDWSWSGFLVNITDGMPDNIQPMLLLAVVYPFFIGAIGHGRGMSMPMTPFQEAGAATAVLLPLFLLPAVYFWKERPQ